MQRVSRVKKETLLFSYCRNSNKTNVLRQMVVVSIRNEEIKHIRIEETDCLL